MFDLQIEILGQRYFNNSNANAVSLFKMISLFIRNNENLKIGIVYSGSNKLWYRSNYNIFCWEIFRRELNSLK